MREWCPYCKVEMIEIPEEYSEDSLNLDAPSFVFRCPKCNKKFSVNPYLHPDNYYIELYDDKLDKEAEG